MTIPARQSTALELSVGPVLDADGVAVTDCVVADFKIKKTTANFAALNGSATLTHVSAGVYDLVLTTSDTDTVGLATIAIDDTVNACASVHLQVMEEVVYDALYAASANAFSGAAGSTKVSGVVLVDTVTTVTGLTASDVGAIKTKTDFLPSATAGAAGGVFIAGSNAATTTASLTTGALACTTITASGAVAFQSTFAVTTSTALAALSCSTLTASGAVALQSTVTVSGATSLAALSTSGTTTLNALTVTNATTLSGAVSLGSTLGITGAITATNASNNLTLGTFTATTFVAGVADAVWDEAIAGHAAAGSTGEALSAAGGAGDPWITTLPGSYTAGQAGHTVGTYIDAAISSRMATYVQPTGFLAATFPSDPADQSLVIAATNTILADTNAILADTDSLDTTKITTARAAVLSDLIDGGRLDLLVDAILARLPTRLTKNTAFSAFMFKMVDATDHVTAETGLTITATRSLDGAAFASCANSATEVSGGWYKIDLAAGDVNGNMVVLRFAGTGADTREVAIVTQP